MRLTDHASLRLQQRGIPPWFLDLLLRHGRTLHDGHGAVLKTMDKGARRRLASVLSPKEFAKAERWFDVYAVVSMRDDAVITAAHRTHRRLH
jgi:hypothetical protein